jgi:hypothetical protein
MSRVPAFVGGVASLLVVVASWSALVPSASTSKDLLVNRGWVERMPKNTKDLVTWFVPLELHGKKFGIAERASHYAFAGERFTYTRSGDKLSLVFQQTDRKATINARAYECKGKAPAPFELCLDLSSGGAKATYYSKKSWKVPGKSAELPLFDLSPLDPEPCVGCVEDASLLFR